MSNKRGKMATATAAIPSVEDAPLPHLLAEKFLTDRVRRSMIKKAPYNPRVVWNRRTGNLVGGHQRIEKYDRMMGYPSKCADYTLTVAVIDVDDATERTVNAALNNPTAQGEFDVEKLEEMLNFPGVRDKIEATGWDQADVMRLFGSMDTDPKAAAKEAQAAADAARANAEKYDASMAAVAQKNSDDFFLVVVFKSADDRVAFTERHGLDDNRYQSGKAMEAVIERARGGDLD